MRKQFLVIIAVLVFSACVLCACGSDQSEKLDETDMQESVSKTETMESDSNRVSLDASEFVQDQGVSVDSDETPESDAVLHEGSSGRSDDKNKTGDPVDDALKDDVETKKPENIRFMIIQNARSRMFTLTNDEGQTLTIDTEADSGYTGTMEPESGEYETGGAGFYVIPYSSKLVLSDMDDDIVYVSAEYPYVVSVAVQNAAVVELNDDRSVIITGRDEESVFSYRVWMPSSGVKHENQNEVLTGQAAGCIRLYYNGSKIAVEQVSISSGNSVTDDDSDIASVDWRTAWPWADRIAKGVWSDGADLSNVDQLKKGIMSAEFVPVDEISENAEVIELIFYDADGNKLGIMRFWKKGNHVEIDGKKFDYDTLGLE